MPTASSAVLDTLNAQRELLAQQSMGLLGAWALFNLLVSGWLVTRTDLRQSRHYFHRMNAAWGAVNALLATWGIIQAEPLRAAGQSLAASLQAQSGFERLLLLSIGLDVAYLMTAAWLHARAAATGQTRPEQLRGFAQSVAVQGGFLLLFDVGLFVLYHRFAAALLLLVP